MKYLLLFFFSANALSQVTPTMNSGEVKINYPCDITSTLPLEKEEKEIISFFELGQNEIYKSGHMLRRRQNTESSSVDFTTKYRTKSPSIILEQKLFAKLSDSAQGELKCEFDVSFNHIELSPTYSCSFKCETSGLIPEHYDFIKMVNKPLPKLPQELRAMKEVKVSATSWKLKLTKAQKNASPFNKKPSVEKWVKGGECRLEISGKISAPSADPKAIQEVAEKGIKFIRSILPGEPSREQGSKTAWALGHN